MTDTLGQLYAEKTSTYFDRVRTEILPLFPASGVERVLEVGCGAGDTLAYLQSSGRCNWTCGVELFPDAAATARDRLDEVFEGNIEHIDLPIEPASLDVVLCLDVLEHLIDPWTTASRLAKLLKPGGVLIASIPNVRNLRVVMPLLLRGRWEYAPFGLMDRTHLRFFTEHSATQLLRHAGLRVDAVRKSGLDSVSKRAAIVLSAGLLEPLLVFQYLIRGVRDA
jgi:2-polyprenyl-3-methyl-5-hydroxy-6-metoxy-1,4-benzoquinol methylase